MNRKLKRTLWILFWACGIGFVCLKDQVGGDYLDTVFSIHDAECVLSEMDSQMKLAHIWITLSVDTLFPLVYSALLVSFVLDAKKSNWFIAPALLAMVFDYCENICHIFILKDVSGLLVLKLFLTYTKFTCIVIAAIIAIRASSEAERLTLATHSQD